MKKDGPTSKRKQRQVQKLIVAIGFDTNRARAVLRSGNEAEPGEPNIGVGRLQAPWARKLDRPLPWALTATGQRLLGDTQASPPFCPNPARQIPQPAHGRWRNPRDLINLAIDPDVYSIFIDDLDCSSDRIRVVKLVELYVTDGDCEFTSGRVQPFGADLRPYTSRVVPYVEPRGWSLQPSAIVFGGELIVPNTSPSSIFVSVRKYDFDSGKALTDSEGTTVFINQE